jgi:hypothetical protein
MVGALSLLQDETDTRFILQIGNEATGSGWR